MSTHDKWLSEVLEDELQIKMKGLLQETNHLEVLSLIQLATVVNTNVTSFQLLSGCTNIKTMPPIYEKVLSSVEANQLESLPAATSN